MPSDKALAIICRGKAVGGGGGRLKFSGRLGRRFAIGFVGGTETNGRECMKDERASDLPVCAS